MIQKIIDEIPKCTTNSCLSYSKRTEEGVYDDPNSWCYFNDQPRHFTIYNPKELDFALLAIDKCLLANEFIGRRCDFAVIQENLHFYVIEIKDTVRKVFNDTSSVKLTKQKKYIDKQADNPIEQIENTLKHFLSLGITDAYPFRTAVLCYRANPPVPLTSCSRNAAKLRFLKEYDFQLMEGNSVTLGV